MKQTIEIEVPDGKKAVWKNDTIVFEDIKPKLPKTWEEFCKKNKVNEGEYYIGSQSSVVEVLVGIPRRNTFDRNILPNKKAAEQHLVLMQLHQLRDCYRQGWVPNWDDENEERYSILHNTIHYIITDTTIESKFLTFQSEEIAQEFLDNFRDLIEQAGDLI